MQALLLSNVETISAPFLKTQVKYSLSHTMSRIEVLGTLVGPEGFEPPSRAYQTLNRV